MKFVLLVILVCGCVSETSSKQSKSDTEEEFRQSLKAGFQ